METLEQMLFPDEQRGLTDQEFAEFVSLMIQKHVLLHLKGDKAITIGDLLGNLVEGHTVMYSTVNAFIKGFSEGINILESKTPKDEKDLKYIAYAKDWLEDFKTTKLDKRRFVYSVHDDVPERRDENLSLYAHF